MWAVCRGGIHAAFVYRYESGAGSKDVFHPDARFVLAHFALGNLARSLGNFPDAKRHFANTSHLLRDHKTDDVLPESDGLTANRLTEIITTITAMQVTP